MIGLKKKCDSFHVELCIAATLKLRAAPDRRESQCQGPMPEALMAQLQVLRLQRISTASRGVARSNTRRLLVYPALFVAGKFIFPDPRATLIEWGQYHLSWVEVLMVGAAMMAMAEQLKGLTSWS